jgi:cellulose biosynthesis protein BcsQ
MPPKKLPPSKKKSRSEFDFPEESSGDERGAPRARVSEPAPSSGLSALAFAPAPVLAAPKSMESSPAKDVKAATAGTKEVSYVEPIIISVCNFKGGVGKTTSLYELAAKYYQKGFRVLMVDADPQCSLTSRVFDLKTLVGGPEDPGSLASQKLQWERERAELNHRTTVAHVFDGLLGHRDDVDRAPTLPNYEAIGHEATPIQVPYAKDDGFKLIPGSIELLRMDECLPARAGQEFNGFLNLPETITHIFRKIAKDQGFDLVFIDLSPAISRWNRAILLGSDCMYVPFMPSVFCYETTQEILKELIREKRALQSLYNNVPVDRGVKQWTIREDRGPYGRVKLLGVFMQAARGHRQSKDDLEIKLFQAYDEWRIRIYQSIQALMPQMREVGLVRGKFYYTNTLFEVAQKPAALHKGNLPEGVKDFCSAGLKAQSQGLPLICMGDSSAQKEQAMRYFGIIARMFMKNAGARFPQPRGVIASHKAMEALNTDGAELGHYRLWYNTDLVNALLASYGNVADRVLLPGVNPELDLNAHAFYYLDGARLVLGNTADVLSHIPIGEGDVLRERLEFHVTNPPYSQMNLLMPLNLDGRHFTLLMLRRRGGVGVGSPVTWEVEYFDPQGVNEATNPIVQRLRGMGYLVVTNQDHGYQEDNYNCGPWIVEAARHTMGRGHLPVGPHAIDFIVPNIYARRNDHQERVPELFDAYMGGSKKLPNIFESEKVSGSGEPRADEGGPSAGPSSG